MMPFEDHFSELAKTYAQHRPRYPVELYRYLASVSPANELAWDVGTGNGQAAVGLASHFERVIATDASDEQIDNRLEHPSVEYRVEPAQQCSLADNSADLITAAVAVHWFDFDRFYDEVRRVARSGGVFAVWTYFFCTVSPEIDALIKEYYYDTLAGHWSNRLRYVEEGYRTLPFPFTEIETPPFQINAQWTVEDLQGFLLSWSGTHSFLEENDRQAVTEMLGRLAEAWGDPDQPRTVNWDLHMRLGRVS